MYESFSSGDFDLAATQSLNHTILLADVLCIPVFWALMKGDLVVILMQLVDDYVIRMLG